MRSQCARIRIGAVDQRADAIAAMGKPVDGLAVRSDRVGALIDSTNPDARAWYWDRIRDNIASQGFDWFWLDETEPDLVPDGFFYSIGSGDRYHNLFPLVHTQGVAEGSRRRPTRQAQPDPRARRVSRRAALRQPVLVFGYPSDMGSAAQPGADRTGFHGLRASRTGATTSAAGNGCRRNTRRSVRC
ncbi:MAG: glycoside hydrolase family 31 protein [Vicinamibacterales bacterium]